MAAQGKFVWYDLMTTEKTAALAFYHAVIGWGTASGGVADRDYTILSAGMTPVGGAMDLPQMARDAGARPSWIGYIGVDDVDAAVARLEAAGGGVHRAAEDIPDVGRFAVVHDPQGATFTLFTPSGRQQALDAAAGTPGHVGWHELHAASGDDAFAFYAEQFGWTKGEPHAMGPMGIYQLFATGGEAVGGMMTKMPNFPVPVWIFYFNVEDTAAAVIRIKDGGGQVLNGPIQVPGGSWIAQALDPQGAMFAVVGPGNAEG
ncbi:VOC family protein [Beijerinckia sp. L45]|uniref:VOC family protein n=1 Tax=Beijerinckia sp. L45 TaxID=1641855 RepID=UPI00131B23FE|nr:VOC family protein [Beijerinckia sp. L45]